MAKILVKAFSEVATADIARLGEQKKGLDDVQKFLTRFGYLQIGTFKSGQLDSLTSDALRKYQERNGLRATGEFDSATRDQMTTHRCAHPDVQDGVAFVTRCAWDRRRLTFAFNNGTNDVAGQAEFQAVRNAFQTWAATVSITFAEVGVGANPDILIDWRDANDPDLSMVGGTLAHADFPPGCGVVTNNLPKPIHFDDSEHMWSVGAVANAFDVETVALHEIGHILGLQHTTVAGAVMFPTVSSNSTLRVLQPDDVGGIRSLYPTAGWNQEWFPVPGQHVFDREKQQVAAVSRAPGNLDLFVIGFDNHIWTTFWNDAGRLEPGMVPGCPGSMCSTARSSRSPRSRGLQATWTCSSSASTTTSGPRSGTMPSAGTRNGSRLPGQHVFDREKQQVAAVSRAPGNLDLFVIGFDNHIWTTFWNDCRRLEPGLVPGSRAACVRPREAAGRRGLAGSRQPGPVRHRIRQPHLDHVLERCRRLEPGMVPGCPGSMCSTARSSRSPRSRGLQATWTCSSSDSTTTSGPRSGTMPSAGTRTGSRLPGQHVFDREKQQVAAVSRAPGNLDLFVIGFDNHIWTTFWNDAVGWNQEWFPAPGQHVFDREKQQVAAVSRAPGNLDLFVIGFDNHIWTTFWTAA